MKSKHLKNQRNLFIYWMYGLKRKFLPRDKRRGRIINAYKKKSSITLAQLEGMVCLWFLGEFRDPLKKVLRFMFLIGILWIFIKDRDLQNQTYTMKADITRQECK